MQPATYLSQKGLVDLVEWVGDVREGRDDFEGGVPLLGPHVAKDVGGHWLVDSHLIFTPVLAEAKPDVGMNLLVKGSHLPPKALEVGPEG